MYSWVSHTWNPIKGCQFECDYCYVKHAVDKYGYDARVRLDEEDLRTRLGRDKIVFVGSMADMWGEWVPKEQIAKILWRCRDFPHNEYVFQSKNPRRFLEFKFWKDLRVVLGTTIETDEYPASFHTNAPSIDERIQAMLNLKPMKRFVTIEPIMDFQIDSLVAAIRAIDPDFVTIGADSKWHGLVEPPWEKAELLISELNKFVEIRQKKNLNRLRNK
jgi:DNA repair photolyase